MKIKINIQSEAQTYKQTNIHTNIQMNRLCGWARIAIDGMMERAPVRIPQSKTLINTDENTNAKTPINETKNDKFDSNFKLIA